MRRLFYRFYLSYHRAWFEMRNRAFQWYLSVRKAGLAGADLSFLSLSGANLRGADLRDANLIRADPTGPDLREASLAWADLSGAMLRGTELAGADVTGVDVTPTELAQAKSLEGATMPDGTLYEDGRHALQPVGAVPSADRRFRDSDLFVWGVRASALSGRDLRGADGCISVVGAGAQCDPVVLRQAVTLRRPVPEMHLGSFGQAQELADRH